LGARPFKIQEEIRILEIEIMMKKYLLVVAVVGALMCGGCATGGNGVGTGITVNVQGFRVAAVNLSTTYTAVVGPTGTSQAVSWTLTGTACTGTPNPCGSFTSSTTGNPITYQAPATPPSSTVTITAASQVDKTATGSVVVKVVPITTTIAPTPVNIGHGLIQQFTATAAPDNVPQTFTWTCTVSGNPCANFSSNTSGLAVYTAAEGACGNSCVNVSAVSSIDPTGCTLDPKDCTVAKGSILASRLVNGPYAFRFSGYDSSHNPIAVAGSISVTNGVITGVEDENTASGPAQHSITAGSYTPSTAGDNNTNNAGALSFTTGGAFPNQFQAVLDANGDFQLIESDGHGAGSGVMQRSATAQFNAAAQPYVFGFSGVDSSGKRVGYVGLLPLDGNGHVSTGTLDANDNGTTTNLCGASPCNVGGSYQYNSGTGVGQLTLTTGITQHFDFFIAGGQTKNIPNPLTLYAISTDAINATHPALSGSIVAQFAGITYDSTVLTSTSVSHVTGIDSSGSNTLVSLIAASGDGNGNIPQVFDSNNAGTIVPATTLTSSPCTYTTSTGGRFVVTLLGTTSTACTGGIPFVFYASGTNRGFLLDQSSPAVMTGGMDPQDGSLAAPTQLPGTFAATTVSSTTSGVLPTASNLLLTSTGNATFPISGTQYPGVHSVSGLYTLLGTGATGSVSGTIVLGSSHYVFYPIDTTHFYMIDVDATVTNPSMIYAQQ
jgi:hypothetical protein